MHSEPTTDYVKADGKTKGNGNRKSFDIEKNSDGNDWDHPREKDGKKSLDDYEDDEQINLLDHYEYRQNRGYFSILFSVAQIAILAIMMLQCGMAPMNINPMVGPYPDVMSYWGAKNAFLILEDGEKWRLITPILLHAGVLHLVGNVHVQLDFGALCEKEWGSLAWLVVYLTSAVGSSIFSTYFMPNNISVGSSGAVMGLFGGKLAEIICKWCQERVTVQDRIGHELRKRQLCMVVGGITLVMLLSFIPYGKSNFLMIMLKNIYISRKRFSCLNYIVFHDSIRLFS